MYGESGGRRGEPVSVATEPVVRGSPTRFEDFCAFAAFVSAPVAAVGAGKHPYSGARSLDRGVRLAESARPAIEVVPANVPELVAEVRVRKSKRRFGATRFGQGSHAAAESGEARRMWNSSSPSFGVA